MYQSTNTFPRSHKLNDKLLTKEEEVDLFFNMEVYENEMLSLYYKNEALQKELSSFLESCEEGTYSEWVRPCKEETLSPEELNEKVFDTLNSYLVSKDSLEEVSKNLLDLNLNPKFFIDVNKYLFKRYKEVMTLTEKIKEVFVELNVVEEYEYFYFLHKHTNNKDLPPAIINLLTQQNTNLEDLYNSPYSNPHFLNTFKTAIEKLKIFSMKVEAIKQKLIYKNLRLVFSRAIRFKNRGLDLDDLRQEGSLGLMKAIDKFNYKLGWKFSTYSTYWIDLAISRAIYNKSDIIRIPVYMREVLNKITRYTREFVLENDREPTDSELANLIKVPISKIKKARQINTEIIFLSALDTTIFEEDRIGEEVFDPAQKDIYAEVLKLTLLQKVKEELSKLSPHSEKLIRLRFGIGESETQNIGVLSQLYNVDEEDLSIIQEKIVEDFQNPSTKLK